MIASWGGLLDSMAARTGDYAEAGVETEIRQLRSLARYADDGALKPIRRGEEFGADSEMRLRQYKRLIDASTERGHRAGVGQPQGFAGNPSRLRLRQVRQASRDDCVVRHQRRAVREDW